MQQPMMLRPKDMENILAAKGGQTATDRAYLVCD